MAEIFYNMISVIIRFNKKLLNNRFHLGIDANANNVLSGDILEISYQAYNYNTDSWGPSNIFKSSSKINNTNINIKNIYYSNNAQKILFVAKIIRDSQIIYTEYYPEIILSQEYLTGPKELNLNSSSNTLSWVYNQNILDLPIDYFELLVNYKNYLDSTDNFTIYRTVSKNDSSYIFDNIRQGNVLFSIVAVDVEGKKSKPQYFNTTQTLHTVKIDQESNIQLFDKTSWENLDYKNIKPALDEAADRWNALVNYSSEVGQILRKFIERITNNQQTFNGMKLVYFSTQSPIENDEAGVRCGPASFIKLSDYEYNTITFWLLMMADPDSYSFDTLVDIMVHELGHAAGIGLYWNSPPMVSENPGLNTEEISKFPYSINSQNHILYSRTQKAYNDRYQFKYPKYHIPINNSGLGQGDHWAHLINETNNFTKSHPAPTYDIMSYGNSDKISDLSVKFLIDIGYRENYADASEYPIGEIPQPDPVPPVLGPAQICGGSRGTDIGFDEPAVDVSGSDTIYNDENIDLESNFNYPTSTPTTPTTPTTPPVETTETPIPTTETPTSSIQTPTPTPTPIP